MSTIYINGRFLTQRTTGVQKFAVEQVVALSKSFNIVILAPSKAVDIFNLRSVRVLKFGIGSGHFWEQVELPLFLKRLGNPTLFSFSGLSPVFYKNGIFTIHDLSFVKEPKWFSLSYRLWYSFAYYIISRRGRRVITVSNFSKGEICKKYTSLIGLVDVVYNIAPELDNHIYKFDYPDFGKYILLVSSLDPRKNIKSFIEAFNKAKVQGYKLVVVGGSSSSFKFDYPSQDFPNIKFLGYVEENTLKSLYKHAYLFAYPSLYEGFGIPPLEAMSMSCPCIVSNAASLPEVCADSVLYFDPHSVDSMAEAIIQGIKDEKLREDLVTRGKIRLAELKAIEMQYSIERVVNESITIK